MNRRPILVTAVALLATALAATGAENVAGIFGIGTSGRALGLGGAFAALADDEGAVFHNPAALGRYSGIGVSSLFARQFGGVSYGSLTVAVPYGGLAVSFLDSGAIATSDGVIRYASQGIVGSVGLPVGPVSFGVRSRFFRLSAPSTGHGWSIDPALLVETSIVRVALLYESALSSPVEYESGASEAWTQSLRLGVAVTLTPAQGVLWNATFEAAGLFSSLAHVALGLEAWIGGLGARVGFDGESPTFGLSVLFATLELDWAYAMNADLGNSHRVALAIRF